MTGGQIAAVGCATVLLLPGGCFLLVGIAGNDISGLTIAIPILAVAGLLFWFGVPGLRRSPGQTDGASTPPDQAG